MTANATVDGASQAGDALSQGFPGDDAGNGEL